MIEMSVSKDDGFDVVWLNRERHPILEAKRLETLK
jgi:hypothetical protein